MWRKSTGLWESDPGKQPNLIRRELHRGRLRSGRTGTRHAIEQQGLLLGYGKQ